MANILAVDDQKSMREMVRIVLESNGHKVTLAEDGVEAMSAARTDAFDMVITDINMPRLDGFGFIEAIRAGDVAKRVPILALTTESAPELKERARNAGAERRPAGGPSGPRRRHHFAM